MSRARDLKRHAQRVRAEAEAMLRGAEPADDRLARYVNDPASFAEALVDPDTGEPFRLYPAERRFLEEAFILTEDGLLPHPELLFSAPKKGGKTTLAAIATLYVVRVLGGRYAEGYCVANDFDQAQGRVFQAVVKIIEASPIVRGTAKVTADKVAFPDSGATITALPADYAGAAGANPSIVVFDELWAYTSERARRLWDEMVPVPTRRVSVRLTVTYAGFEGESELLEELYKRGCKGQEIAPCLYRQPGLLMYWSHDPVAPWQTHGWLGQMRQQLRPNAYLRMIENRFVSSESGFVEMEWWDRCVNPDLRPVVADKALPAWVGVDASVRRDETAIVAVTWTQEKRVRLAWHRTFQPTPEDPLDFEATVEETLHELRRRFRVREVLYDPYQLISSAQRLAKAGLRMVEFPQTVPNLTEASQTLYDLVKGGGLEVYPDDDLRLAMSHAVAKETVRGWRIAKEKASQKIDVVVALAMATLACVKGAPSGTEIDSATLAGLLALNDDLVAPSPWDTGESRSAISRGALDPSEQHWTVTQWINRNVRR